MNKFRDNKSMIIAVTVATLLAYVAYQVALNLNDEYGIGKQVAYYLDGLLIGEFFVVFPLLIGIYVMKDIFGHPNYQPWLKLILMLAETGILAIVLTMSATKVFPYLLNPNSGVLLNMLGPGLIFGITQPLVIGVEHLYDYIIPKL